MANNKKAGGILSRINKETVAAVLSLLLTASAFAYLLLQPTQTNPSGLNITSNLSCPAATICSNCPVCQPQTCPSCPACVKTICPDCPACPVCQPQDCSPCPAPLCPINNVTTIIYLPATNAEYKCSTTGMPQLLLYQAKYDCYCDLRCKYGLGPGLDLRADCYSNVGWHIAACDCLEKVCAGEVYC